MSAEDLDGGLVKLQRAGQHLTALHEAIQRFLATEPYDVVGEAGARSPVGGVIRAKVLKEPSPIIPALVGDSLYCLRSALDHLAYYLAVLNSGYPPPSEDKIEFPIFHDARLYRDLAPKKIGAIDPDAQAVIDGLQPYRAGGDPKTHDLWVLHALTNIDKHRRLHFAGSALEGSRVDYLNIQDVEIYPHEIILGPFEHDAVVVRLHIAPSGPSPRVDVNSDFRFDVAFEKDGPAGGALILPKLLDLMDHLLQKVVPPLRRFLPTDPVAGVSLPGRRAPLNY